MTRDDTAPSGWGDWRDWEEQSASSDDDKAAPGPAVAAGVALSGSAMVATRRTEGGGESLADLFKRRPFASPP